MLASLGSRSLRASTSYLPSALLERRTLHVSSVVLARKSTPKPKTKTKKKKRATGENPEAMAIPDAVFLLKSVEVARPNNAIELHVRAEFKRGEAALRGRIALPRDPRLKAEKILVFAESELADKAIQAGATWAGGELLVQEVLDGKVQPTFVISTPGMLPSLSKLGRTLGPKGLMPNVKRGTVMQDVVAAVHAAKGVLTWKGDKLGYIRAAVGRINFPPEEIENNIKAFLQNVKEGGGELKLTSYEKAKTYSILQVHMSSTQGPGIELKAFQ